MASVGKRPARAHEMTGIPVWNTFKVVLVFGLSFPELAGGHDLCDDLSWPETGRINVRDRIFGNALLLFARVENGRAVACANVVPLTIQSGRIMNLEEELQQIAVCDFRGVEDNLNRLGVTPMIPIGRVRHVSTRVSDPRRDDSVASPNQVLHSPKATTCQNGSFSFHPISSDLSRWAPQPLASRLGQRFTGYVINVS